MAGNPLLPIENLDPYLIKQIKENRENAFGKGKLPEKYKYLIAMCLDASQGASDGVAKLARLAVKNGATKEEIGEALRITNYICGVGAIYTAAEGITDLKFQEAD